MSPSPQITIPATPTLSPAFPFALLGKGALAGPFRPGRFQHYYQARYALWHGLSALGISRDCSVAVPALQCGTELDAFVDLGIHLDFYNVDSTLTANLKSVEQAIGPRTAAVFITHYFGFPQNLDALTEVCRRRNVFLIEDCAHTLNGTYRDRHLGTFGDFSVFSPRKFFPLIDGGTLLMKENGPVPRKPAGSAPVREQLGWMKLKLSRHLESRSGRAGRLLKRLILTPIFSLRKKRRRGSPSDSNQDNDMADLYRFFPNRLNWRMSPVSKRILETANWEAVAARRRANFEYLADHVRESEFVKIVIRTRPDGLCPWMFPVLVADTRGFASHLQSFGIEIGVFWQYCHPAFPTRQFPQETHLKEHLMTLPVHQQLGLSDMETIVKAVNSWQGGALS